MTDALWTLDRVCLAGQPNRRLDDVSLKIRPGVTAIVGFSGAGKTSLLNLLVGYESPDAGIVTCHRRSANAEATDGVLPVFWIPQDDGLWPQVTVQRHLELVAPDTDRGDVRELLSDFDLSSVAEATPDRLSRGEASRLAVARAIASRAAVLVLDELLAHVDPARRGRYWSRLIDDVESRSASLIFSSHEPGDVLRYADHAVGLADGRVAFDGDVALLYERPPDVTAALLLGPMNWLPEPERSRWNASGAGGSPCVRPERLAIEPCAVGAVSVVASRSAGTIVESELRCHATGETRQFLHRPAAERLLPGAGVRLIVLSLLAVLALPGCLPSGDGPELVVKAERRFSLPAKGSLIPQPRDVAIGLNDEKIVLDNGGRVLVYDAAGELIRQWDMPESSDGNPEGACVLPDGRIVVADTHYHRVVTFDPQGRVVGTFGTLGRGPGQFIYPVAVTTDLDGNLYVAEYGGNDRVQKFAPSGTLITEFGSFGTGKGQFQRPSGVVWSDGTLYVVDAFNSRVHLFTDSGSYRGLLGTPETGLHYPYDLSLGTDGRLYVVEYGAGRVTVLTTDGVVEARYGTTGSGRGQLATPWGLGVDRAGRIWIADTGNRRIVEIVPAGVDADRPLPTGFVGGMP